MRVSYEKMTEECYMQLTLFHPKDEGKRREPKLLIDMSRISVPLYFDKRVSIPNDIDKLNIDIIQLKSESFQENLAYLKSLLIVINNREKVPDINIRIYSQHYDYFQKEINSALYCDSSEGFGNYKVHIGATKIIVAIALRKIGGLRLSGIAYKAYCSLKKLCH
ncbi:hypothetical protein D8L93_10925 [Sodalis-like symbiont of Bactericera trigonica]|nr:hypothetical protein D8L93_10925 [Sodalis-like symbiont of Bactericera trigonica]